MWIGAMMVTRHYEVEFSEMAGIVSPLQDGTSDTVSFASRASSEQIHLTVQAQ